MSIICDADLQYLKPGKKVVLKSFNGNTFAPADVRPNEDYWRLIGAKAVAVKMAENKNHVLLQFEQDLNAMGLASHNDPENSLWILISDLKFVCRY